tara:strand:+ start:17558 stop:18001 length:444 start_codon:yes stop_codon:yes gene_type:complete
VNKEPQSTSKFPFLTDPGHIYNQLTKDGITSVDVGWAKFTFVLGANLFDNGEELYGITLFDECLIKLDINMPDYKAREIIFHEIFHIILDNLGLDEMNFKGEFVSFPNEALVVGVSKQFSTINRLNPGLLSLVMSPATPFPQPKKRK